MVGELSRRSGEEGPVIQSLDLEQTFGELAVETVPFDHPHVGGLLREMGHQIASADGPDGEHAHRVGAVGHTEQIVVLGGDHQRRCGGAAHQSINPAARIARDTAR